MPRGVPTAAAWLIIGIMLGGFWSWSGGAGNGLIAWLRAFITASADNGQPLRGCRAVDGDTLRCGSERIRLIGIDTPEMPGHCRRGRRCVEGDPHAARESLQSGLQEVTIARIGRDHYGRTLAMVHSRFGDLSCRQLERGHATYRSDWDDGLRVMRACPKVALLN